MNKFKLAYLDPPWSYNDKATAGLRGAAHKYQTLTIPQLKQLPIPDLLDNNSLLAMWWVAAMPQEALDLVKYWGLTFKTMTGLAWFKTTKYGKPAFGMGNYTRAGSENCLFALKGKFVRHSASERALISTVEEFDKFYNPVITASLRQHSQKPDEAYTRLENLVGPVPKIELFARNTRPNWTSVGNGIDGKDIFTALEELI